MCFVPTQEKLRYSSTSHSSFSKILIRNEYFMTINIFVLKVYLNGKNRSGAFFFVRYIIKKFCSRAQHSDASEARTLGLESSTLPLSHCAPIGLDKQFLSKIKNIFLPIILAYVLGAQRDGSFEYPQHMFRLRNKKKLFSVTYS